MEAEESVDPLVWRRKFLLSGGFKHLYLILIDHKNFNKGTTPSVCFCRLGIGLNCCCRRTERGYDGSEEELHGAAVEDASHVLVGCHQRQRPHAGYFYFTVALLSFSFGSDDCVVLCCVVCRRHRKNPGRFSGQFVESRPSQSGDERKIDCRMVFCFPSFGVLCVAVFFVVL